MLTLEKEVRDFVECNGVRLKYWVIDETSTLDATYQQLADAPNEPIYLEMKALNESPLLLGYAEERDGLTSVRKILKMNKESVNNPCYSKQ